MAQELLDFIGGAELVIHNAAFDVTFLDAELARLPGEARTIAALCKVLDTLALARSLHPGQRNGLDALRQRVQDRVTSFEGNVAAVVVGSQDVG